MSSTASESFRMEHAGVLPIDGPVDERAALELAWTGTGWCIRARGRFYARPASRLRVQVGDRVLDDDALDVAGEITRLEDGLRFDPDFPFEPGVQLHALLDTCGSHPGAPAEPICGSFLIPPIAEQRQPAVVGVFPSAATLPENLLRFYVRFDGPMRRGHAGHAIRIDDENGRQVPDVLYRPPIELWDRTTTCLTVLLDPGRLKRGVGPNRALGSPLVAGRHYALRIGADMVDATGRRLREDFVKRFRVSAAVRRPVDLDAASLRPVTAGSREPLELSIPQPLDWAQFRTGIRVVRGTGEPIFGRVEIDREETHWRFEPRDRWRLGAHAILVPAGLEDFCGNTPSAPFDGPFRSARAKENSIAHSIGFTPL